jgi:hypothetical protein
MKLGASPYLHGSQRIPSNTFWASMCVNSSGGKLDGGMSRCKFAVGGKDGDAVGFKCAAKNQGHGG